MSAHDMLSEDGQAMLLLCSTLGKAVAPDIEPYTISEWNQLARKIHASPYQRPAALLGQGAAELADALQVTTGDAERIVRLLDRSGQVAMELENLFSRGLWALTRMDEQYPAKLKQTLKHQAPTVLFGAGDLCLLKRQGIAVVGSRNIDAAAVEFAAEAGRKIAHARMAVISGGAKGSDRIGMDGGLSADGKAIGVLADSLERTVRQPEVRQFLLDGQLVLLTPFGPDAGFTVGTAMGRNKVIYGLSEYAIVVSSDLEKGGTWAGATEALKARWCPVFVRQAPDAPKGNQALLKHGAIALESQQLNAAEDLPAWLEEHAPVNPPEQTQAAFDFGG
ncbi:MAG: DNA-processing protein DprA [Verrucomicrobiota bacterium]